MHRPDGDDVYVGATPPAMDPVGPNPGGWFRHPNPGAGQKGTILDEDFLNDWVWNLEEIRVRAGMPVWTKGSKDDLADAIETFINAGTRQYNPGHIRGLHHELGVNDRFGLQAGTARSLDDAVNLDLAATLAKRIDLGGGWVAGDDNAGRPTGVALAANTWYPTFLIRDAIAQTGVLDGGIDLAANADTAALLLAESGFDHFRRTGWIRTNGASQVINAHQRGDVFLWNAPGANLLEADANLGAGKDYSAGQLITLAFAPPNSIALVNAVASATSNEGLYITPTWVSNEAANATSGAPAAPGAHIDPTAAGTATYLEIPLDGNSQFRVHSGLELISDLFIATLGWRDHRGRDF